MLAAWHHVQPAQVRLQCNADLAKGDVRQPCSHGLARLSAANGYFELIRISSWSFLTRGRMLVFDEGKMQ
jgi:hypothetical protein